MDFKVLKEKYQLAGYASIGYRAKGENIAAESGGIMEL